MSAAPRVDFYVMQRQRDPLALVCALADKAYASGHRVYIRAASPAQAAALDRELWVFRDTSFVPHAQWPVDQAEPPPVLIGQSPPPPTHAGVLINLGADVPDYAGQFQRVLELVEPDDAQRKASRGRFRSYKAQGWELDTHQV